MRSSWAAERADFVRLTDGSSIRHQPGLDGLRGLAVAAVVLFHTGLGWLPGGYLGVSLFFTISGAVIGTVILHEIQTRGDFSLRGFWARRARRLFPAAWLLLAVVAIARVVSTVFSSTSPGDVVASWVHVANWHFLAADTSYADLFGGPSAVLHFWSLAIEEQFYLGVGLAAVVLARRSSRPARHLAIGAAGLAVVSFALPQLGSLSVDRTYYGTDTRAGELLVGLVIACVIADPARRRLILRAGRVVALVAVAALVLAVVLWRVLEAGDAGLGTWVLPISALVSCALVAGALVPGPVLLLTSWPPLRRLGGISYALYLVHWPVFVAVRRADPDAGVAELAVAIGVSLALAVLSTRLVEAPVRARRVSPQLLRAGAASLAGCMLVAAVLPARRTEADMLLRELESAAAAGALTSTTAVAPSTAPSTTPSTAPSATSPPATTPTPTSMATPADATAAGGARPTVAFVGDSIAFSLAFALGHATEEARFVPGSGTAEFGCGIALSPNRVGMSNDPCDTLVDRMAALVRERGVDGVVVVSCQWELVEQPLPGTSEPRVPGDPVFDAYVKDAYRRAAEELRAAGAEHVMWLRCPPPSTRVVPADLGRELRDARDPRRMAAINAIVDELAAAGVLEVLDLAAWVEPRLDDPTLRADGSHFVYEEDTGVASELTRLINEAVAS